jgi:hypothetical protein
VRALALAFAALLFACDTRVVDLAPSDARAEDARAEDARAMDAAAPDATPFPDATIFPDAEPPDSGSSCICRLACRTDPECAASVGARSTCLRGTCTGGTNACQSDAECDPGFSCAASDTSLDPC